MAWVRIGAVAAVMALGSVGAAAAAPPQFFPGAMQGAPFSGAVRVGDVVHVSGAIGLDAQGKLPDGFGDQARNAMLNVRAELAQAGAGMDDVYQCEVALTDMKNWPAFNAVYAPFFKAGRYPVRMATGATALARGGAVEVACSAYLPVRK